MSEPGAHPSSWRDVYDLVKDTRAEIMEAVDKAERNITATAKDHEDRIRDLEEARQQAQGSWRAVTAMLTGASILGGLVADLLGHVLR